MAKDDRDYKLNEPKPEIPGGSTRVSVRVNRKKLGAVADRERVEQALAVHDLDGSSEGPTLREEDGPILRMIARETIASSLQPALRAKAIGALAEFPTVENLNTLSELATHGDDVYVRSHALVALGASGLVAVGATLARSLSAPEKMERTAAEKALLLLSDRVGPGIFDTVVPDKRDRSRLRSMAEELRKTRERRGQKRRYRSKQKTSPSK